MCVDTVGRPPGAPPRREKSPAASGLQPHSAQGSPRRAHRSVVRRVDSGGECGAPRGEGRGGRHGVRGASGGVPARGPGLSPNLCLRARPSPPVFTLRKHSSEPARRFAGLGGWAGVRGMICAVIAGSASPPPGRKKAPAPGSERKKAPTESAWRHSVRVRAATAAAGPGVAAAVNATAANVGFPSPGLSQPARQTPRCSVRRPSAPLSRQPRPPPRPRRPRRRRKGRGPRPRRARAT